jgi:large conductance mechanosensitive channel
MIKGFRDFILRGNVMDLAVAVIIGAAFTAIVTSLVKDIITPFIAALLGTPDFAAIKYPVHGSNIMIGNFLNALIAFVLVVPTQYLMKKFNPPAAEPVTTRACPQCLGDIPVAATRCKFCTQPV